VVNILGIDIGGANLKAATHEGRVRSLPFPLWQKPNELQPALRRLAAELCNEPQLVAVTMTGELADCFETKDDGVQFITGQVEAAFPGALIRIWMTSGEFAEPDDARDLATLVAAANWHATATWAARTVPSGRALLIDVGSTTTDIIPLEDGIPVNRGRTDLERLATGELLYTGATRTPVCAVVQTVQLRGATVPVAAEFFATMQDVHIVTGQLPESPDDTATADSRPATRANCLNRLAHMLCCDRTELTNEELRSFAEQVAAAQQRQLEFSLSRSGCGVEAPCDGTAAPELPALILCGSGTFVAERAIASVGRQHFGEVFRLSTMYRQDVSQAACAFAVARLAAERCLEDLLPLTS
jgi:(4-(4-[2-(gamma-L-glutamylamino)ethyl]phenoxymethyl)furan-2-yl)methanamine synthase